MLLLVKDLIMNSSSKKVNTELFLFLFLKESAIKDVSLSKAVEGVCVCVWPKPVFQSTGKRKCFIRMRIASPLLIHSHQVRE